MANNPALFNAIINGITGGNQQRWANQTGEINYSIFQAVAITVATAVDAAIPPASINGSQADLMQAICQGIFSHRDATNIRHDLPAIAARISEIYAQFSGSLQPIIRPEITGATVEDQIEELIIGLNSLGIILDAR